MNAHNWINDGIWHTILPCFSLNRYSEVLGYWLWNLLFLICRIKNAPHSGFLGGSVIKNLPEMWGPRFDPWVRKIPWRRAWQPTLVLLPRESHGQKSLAGCSPEGHTEKDMTEEAKQQGDCGPRVEAASTRFCSVHDGQPASQAKRGSSEHQIKILVFK